MGDVLGVAVVVEGEAVVGDDDPAAEPSSTRRTTIHSRHHLVWPYMRVAEVGGVGVGLEDRLLGARDPETLLVVLGEVDGGNASSATGTGRPGGSNSHGFIHPR
ncbi:MAG: hypothetical protein U0W40_03875 [Acidimicrobiia bacterium]